MIGLVTDSQLVNEYTLTTPKNITTKTNNVVVFI